MSLLHYYTGPCVVLWKPGDGFDQQTGTQVELGISENAIEIKSTPYFEEIYSDSRGGENGRYSDRIWLGSYVQILLRLTKFQDDTANQKEAPAPFVEQLMDGMSGGPTSGVVPGTLERYGYLERDDEYLGELTLDNTIAVDPLRNEREIVFPKASLKSGGKKNEGTKYMTFEFLFEADIDADATRVLYTLTNTVPS